MPYYFDATVDLRRVLIALMVFGLSAAVDSLPAGFLVVTFLTVSFSASDFLVVVFFAATFFAATFFFVDFLAVGFFFGDSSSSASAVAIVVLLIALVVLIFLTPLLDVDRTLDEAGAVNCAGFGSSTVLLVGRISQYPSNFAPCTTISDVAFKLPSSEPVDVTSTLPRASTLPLTVPLTVRLLD